MSIMNRHKKLERHSLLLTAGILVTVAIGGIVEIAPLFYLENTIEKVEGMRPYTPLELMGRNIYIREGCYTCHSQMIRPLRDEIERYGHYSLAAESMYDHPFQWGSKRTGPDLARVGGKYSDAWHVDHLINPPAMVENSIMPPYRFLAEKRLRYDDIADHMRALRRLGVPYTDDMIANARTDIVAQASPGADYGAEDAFLARYDNAAGRPGTVKVSVFDQDPSRITEMDAMVAYLQMLGTLVDFSAYKADDIHHRR
jgi:cytochrome c oxidase cbb3-type subunit 2